MLTISIPTSKMADGRELFIRCLESLWDQTNQDFEIVVTDNCDDKEIEEVCVYYKTGISYYKNPIKGMAQNTNESIRRAKGELIKVLYMDDFLADTEAIDVISKKFTPEYEWLVCSCIHVDAFGTFGRTHHPYYNANIVSGANTIGSPSVMTIRNNNPMLFDENMTWLLDCDYYVRMYEKFGEPKVIHDPLVGIGIHAGQATNIMGDEIKLAEHEYIKNKYGK